MPGFVVDFLSTYNLPLVDIEQKERETVMAGAPQTGDKGLRTLEQSEQELTTTGSGWCLCRRLEDRRRTH